MQLSVEEKKSVEEMTAWFVIKIPADECSTRLDAELDKLAESAELPGFRKGKAPRALLLRRYGDEVRGQIENAVIGEAVRQVFEEKKIRTIRDPRIENFSSSESEGLSFEVIADCLPDIGSIDLGAFSFERLELEEVPTETIERELESLAESHRAVSKPEPARAAVLGDMVLVHARAEKDGEEISALGGPLRLVLGRKVEGDEQAAKTAASFDKALTGANVGDEREVPYTVPEAVAQGNKDLAGKKVDMKLRVVEIYALSEPPTAAELAKGMGLPDEAGLRGRIRAQIAEAAEQASERILRRAIFDNFADKFDFPLPKRVLEDEFHALVHAEQQEAAQAAGQAAGQGEAANDNGANDNGANEGAEGVEGEGVSPSAAGASGAEAQAQAHSHPELPKARQKELRSAAERRLRIGVVLSEIAHQNAIRVSPEELRNAMAVSAQRYGERAQEALAQMERDPRIAQSIHGSLLEEKVFRYIVKSSKLAHRAVPLSDLEAALAKTEEAA